MRIIYFLSIVLFLSKAVFGQGSSFNPLFEIESLSGIQVNDLKQDSLGFLWVGTNEGLYRYDGYNLKLYYATPTVIGSSVIHEIFFDKQNEMWVATYGGLLKYSRQTDQFVTLQHDPKNNASIRSNRINCISEGQDGNLWIGFSKGGIDRYNKKEKKFTHYLVSDKTGLSSDDISELYVDKENNLWVATWNHGLHKLDLKAAENKIPETARFETFTVSINSTRTFAQLCMFEDSSGHLYVGTSDHGLLVFNKQTSVFERCPVEGLRSSINNVLALSPSRVLAATLTGVRIIDLDKRVVENCEAPMCEMTNTVYVIFKDNQNITWLGTDDGLKKYTEKKVEHVKLDPLKNTALRNNVIAMCKQDKYIWLGTWGDGLFLKDEQTGQLLKVNANNRILTSIWDIKLVNGNMLLIGSCDGLVRLDVSKMSFKNNFKEYNHPSDHYFTTFTKNTTGDTWAGTWKGGVYKIDSETGEVSKFDKFNGENHYIQSIHLENDNLWIGTVHSGLYRISELKGSAKIKIFSQQTTDLSSDFVSVIMEDHEHKLWIGTSGGGINIFDLKTQQFKWILKGEQNLQSSTIRAIIQDHTNDIWVSFKSGISRLHKNGVFINYTEDDGFENLAFNPNSALRDGEILYFGNKEGYDRFNPSDLIFQKDPSKVFITDFKIFGRSIAPGESYEGRIMFDQPINELDHIALPYRIKNIGVEFSSLNFTNPKREIFAYMLEGLDERWTYTNAVNRTVSYSNLSPGEYTLKIKTARNSDVDQQQGRILKITIIPPIWQTTWFIVLACLAFIGLLYLFHWLRLRSLQQQKLLYEGLAYERIKVIEEKNQQLEQQNIEIQNQAAKLHEADQSKINFFANISHEFRTPLMLIVGPIARLIENNDLSGNESLSMIHRNAKRLLRLIDQIMDFTKIEAGNLKLETEEGEIVHFLKEIIGSFNYVAKTKNIKVEFYSSEDECVFNFDHDKVEKIFYNLLSNAFKVTPPAGRITVTVEMLHGVNDNSVDSVRIEIFNSGKGISKDELTHIFTRFYRTKSYTDGTGIGLSLTKSLVELHGGVIEVKSEENEGTWFCVTLPVDQSKDQIKQRKDDEPDFLEKGAVSIQKDAEVVQSPLDSPIEKSQNQYAKTILILDDDEDMLFFIAKLLSPTYNVIKCSNGEQALKLAYKHQPDLILSDMMMPVMDGYQFLKAVKEDSNISHIPIILLTARASMDARLKGLEEGADDYITKPFHEKILLLRVKNLIERMQRAKQRFSTDINLEPREITITSLDEKFMKDLLDVVEQNIANTDFGSDTICQELGVGRSYLYAKVKALTDLPVNEFVKTIRLKRAAVLLTKGQLNVNEVAYSVGFNDRYYFSKCFLKHFGISPSQYQNENSDINPSFHK